MPAFTLPSGIFPELHLTKEETQMLAEQADEVLDRTIAAYEEFVANNRKLSKQEYKLMLDKEGLKIFKERHVKSRRHNSSSSSEILEPTFIDSSVESSRSTMDEAFMFRKPSHVPSLICHGKVDGNVEDIVYGAFAADDASWRAKSKYCKDKFDDAKILATIRGPTEHDPYRFLGVKWFAIENPFGLNAFMQRRDFLILEATGLTRGSNGEPMCFSMYQSVTIPQIRELTDMKIIRGFASTCFIGTQLTSSTLELYCRSFTDVRGGVPASIAASRTADQLAAVLNVIECSYLKKLTWLVRHKQGLMRLESQATERYDDHCKSCSKTVNKFGAFLSGSACRVCRNVSFVRIHFFSVRSTHVMFACRWFARNAA